MFVEIKRVEARRAKAVRNAGGVDGRKPPEFPRKVKNLECKIEISEHPDQGCIVSFRVVSFSILAYSYSFRFV